MENDSRTSDESSARADLEAICRLVAEGKPVDDFEPRSRIVQRSADVREQAPRATTKDFANRAIRELRGPLDEEQERELTMAQQDLVRRGEARLKDPETGEEYVLVPVSEYERLRQRR